METEQNFELKLDPEWFLALASQHAHDSDDGLDAEIDDLEDYLDAAWGALDAAQRKAVWAAPALKDVVERAGGKWRPASTQGKSILDGNKAVVFLKGVAYAHGEDTGEPDHEVGDLQEIFRIVLPHLNEQQCRSFLLKVSDIIELGFCEPMMQAGEEVVVAEWNEACKALGRSPDADYAPQQIADLINVSRLMASQPEAKEGQAPMHATPLAERP